MPRLVFAQALCWEGFQHPHRPVHGPSRGLLCATHDIVACRQFGGRWVGRAQQAGWGEGDGMAWGEQHGTWRAALLAAGQAGRQASNRITYSVVCTRRRDPQA